MQGVGMGVAERISIDTRVSSAEKADVHPGEAIHPGCGSHPGLRWYCAQAKPGQVFTARDHLIRQQFEVLVPLGARRTLTGVALEPLLGPYFLVRFDVRKPGWRRICSSRGVARLFGSTPEAPSPLRDADVERLREVRVDTLGEPPRIGSGVEAGCVLRVLEGPLRGRVGLCLDVVSATVRCLVFAPGGPQDMDLPLRWCRRA